MVSQTKTMVSACGYSSSDTHLSVSARSTRVLVLVTRAWRSHSSGAKHMKTSATPLRTYS